MREIKFRAWNGEEFSTGWLGDIYSYENINDDGLLTQFTGLKDKNGKEIWEGDISKNKYGNISVVEYKRGGFYPYCEPAWEMTDDWEECEIIGNRFENPDLIP